MATVRIGDRLVGDGQPCLVVAELASNHAGSLDHALRLVRAAHAAGADCVKLQRRSESMVCIPPSQRDAPRELPGGQIVPYADYRRRLELGWVEYDAIDADCRGLGLPWTASVWDEEAVGFVAAYRPPFLKVPSAALTDVGVLQECRRTGLPVVLSTGMSTLEQIDAAVARLDPTRLVLLHCVSAYPAEVPELNLYAMRTLAGRYGVPVGFSDHSRGVWAPLCAAVLGAAMVEKHFTLDRAGWPPSDQAASVEPEGLARIVRYVRRWEQARGDGVKRVLDSERPVIARLRRVP